MASILVVILSFENLVSVESALLEFRNNTDNNNNNKFSEFIKPICLPLSPTQLYRSYVGERLYVTGWGDTGESRQSDVKMKVQVIHEKKSIFDPTL